VTELQEIRDWIKAAERIVVLTGAGISTDSGIPDFRGPKGVWTQNPKAEKMATLQHYVADPEVREAAWQSRMAMFGTPREPNAGHLALVELEKDNQLQAILTQNVDGLHHAAGSDPEKIVEIHGTVREVVCLSCEDRWPMQHALDRVTAGEADPECVNCGGILKSATISFGQALVPEDLSRAQEEARNCDLLLAIGSTLGVYPIAGVVPLAQKSGARVVILNGEPTEMDGVADAVIHAGISETLSLLLRPDQESH
jgi:NAD-dependent deacetylase